MLERSAWATLIPHAGPMALIDRVLHYDDDGMAAESDNHRSPAHPLRRCGRLHAVHLCEYGAQAMAVHGALVARDAGGLARPGWLVALRHVDLSVGRIDNVPGALQVAVHREQADEAVWLYRFDIHHAGQHLAAGRAMVKLAPEHGAMP